MKADLSLPENRAAFRVLYYGQKILFLRSVTGAIIIPQNPIKVSGEYIERKNYVLSLRPISSLTDAEALHIGKNILGWGISDESMIYQVKEELLPGMYNKQTNLSGAQWLKIFQYLIQLGILIPFRGNSCEEIIESGCAVYRKEGE